MSSELIDAKIEASEARTDAKFAELIGRLDLLDTNIIHLGTHVDTTRWIVGIGMAFIALLVGIMEIIGQ